VLETPFLALRPVEKAWEIIGPNEVPPEPHCQVLDPVDQALTQTHSTKRYLDLTLYPPLFLSLRSILVALRSNRFSIDLENPNHLEEYLESLFYPGEF
jgi:hypothetical protein